MNSLARVLHGKYSGSILAVLENRKMKRVVDLFGGLMKNSSKFQFSVLVIATIMLAAILVYSGIQPYDRITWLLEIFPVLIIWPVIICTYSRFPLTGLLYTCVFIHALVLITGGAYSYARVPLGFAIENLFHLERNPYDKIGHFFQGFVPALAAREILIRGQYVQGRKMLAFIVISITLAISAGYELFEWASAVALGQGADEFLGTQGDPWDTQSDMFFALIGSVTALSLFSGIHDRQIKLISPDSSDSEV